VREDNLLVLCFGYPLPSASSKRRLGFNGKRRLGFNGKRRLGFNSIRRLGFNLSSALVILCL
jgi:hypothetical protein